MPRISELERAAIALREAQKERKIGKVKIRMDYQSTPGVVTCHIKDGVGSIHLHGVNEIRGLINELTRLIGETEE
jgi:hypothetical protein